MNPLKRIGQEVQYKKLKGNYLYAFAGVLLVFIVFIMVLLSTDLISIFKILGIGLMSFIVFQILTSFQRKSTQDYFIDVRRSCSKANFRIKGEIIKLIAEDEEK